MTGQKITIALLWPRYGGKVTSVNDLVLGLDRKRFDIILIYLSRYGADNNFIEEAGYDVFYLSDIKRVNTFRFSILFRLVKILKERNVDIIHCHRHKPTIYGAIAAAIAKTPVVLAHVHGLGRSSNLKRKLMNLLLFRKINRLVPVANSVKKDVLRNNWFLPSDKLSVLENSVDYKRFADVPIPKEDAKKMMGIPPDAFVVGTIGRFAPTKGLSYLMEAFVKVKEKIPSARFVLLGDGRCRAKLQKQANKICHNSIHFLGYRKNIEQLLRGMDMFVLASLAEGMPRAILEAMAAGVPCVATRVGGIPEIINGQDVGVLVPPRDSAALAKAMISVANMSTEELEKRTEKARDRVRQLYSHKVIREKLKNLYEHEFKACVKNS